MAVKYGLTKEEQEELRAARAQKSDGGGEQEQSQNSRYDRTTNRMRYGLSEAEQQYFSKSRSDKRKAEIQQINQSAGWRTTAYTKARERTASAYDSYNSLVEDYQALFDENKILRADKADRDTISALLSRADALYKERTSGTSSGLRAMQDSLRSIQARNVMWDTVSAIIPDNVERAISKAQESAAKVQAGAAAIPGLPGDRMKFQETAQTVLDRKNDQNLGMTVEEAGQRYREISDRLNELNRSGRTYGVMEQGGVYTPEAEKERKELLEEQDQLSQYIRQLEYADAMQHDSAYWAKKASHEEDRLQEANAYRSGYGGVMQSGVVLDSEKTRRAEDIQREFDKAREYYYYTKNAEDWNRMTPELQEKAMEAAKLDVDGVFDWSRNYYYEELARKAAEEWNGTPLDEAEKDTDGGVDWEKADALSRSGLSPDQRAALSRADSDRVRQIRQEITDAGFDADRILEYANRMWNQQKMREETQSMEAFGTGSVAGGVAATVATYGANLLSGIGSVGLLAQRVFGSGKGITEYRPVDYNDPSTAFSQVTQQTRQAIGGQMGETGQFFYNALNNAVDSAARMLVGQAIGNGFLPEAVSQEAIDRMNRIVSGAVSAQMNAQVFTDAFISAKQNGATDDDAILDAIVQAAIEGITEKYSVDAILKNPKQLTWTALRNSFLAEGSEEIASDVLNTIYDELKNGSDSELRSEAQAYIDAGIGTEEAWKRVLGSYAKQLILDGLAGGLSGLAMGVASEASRTQEYKQFYGDIESGQALVDEAMELNPESITAMAAQDRLERGKPITAFQAANLTEMNNAAAGEMEEKESREAAEKERAERKKIRSMAEQYLKEQTQEPKLTVTRKETATKTETMRRESGQRMTVKTGKAGTSVRGTDVVKAVKVGDNDIVIQKTDGSTASINTLDQRGTALEVLQFAKELPDYRDTMTVNGMMRAYESYLGNTRGNRSAAERFFDNYVIAVAAGAEGESLADALGVTTDRKMQTAMESGWRRGVEIAKGRRISMEMGSAGQAAMEQYGYLYPQMFSEFYRAGAQGATFQQAMDAAGVKSLGEIKKTEMKAAWKAGRKDGMDYEVERYAVSDAGGQRENGLGAGGKAGSLEAGTGGSEGREGGRVVRRGGGDAENRTSLKKLGVKSGTDAPQEVVSREKNEHGGEIITVSDRLLVRGQDGTEREVQAIQSGNNVILRADDPMMEQHKAHELEHIRQRSMTDEEITAVFREKTKSLSDERLRRILSAYALDYYGLYGEDDTTMADLYREYLADEAAGIRHNETDQDVILPGEQTGMTDRRGEVYAMRGNQNQDYFTRDKYYDRQIDKWEQLKRGGYITVGTVNEGSPLNQIGIPAGKLYFDVTKIRAEMEERSDPIGPEIMKGIPDVLANPIVITEFIDRNGTPSASVYGKLYIHNSPVVVGVMTAKTQKGVVVSKVQTVHAKRNFMDDIKPDKVLYINGNKKETRAWFQSLSAQMPPLGEHKSGFIRSISQKAGKSNIADKFSISSQEPQSSAEYAQTQRASKQREALMEQSTKQTFELRRQFTEGTERDLSASDLPGIAADLRRIYGKKSMGQTELQERLEHIATVKAGERSPMEAYRRAKDEADILAADMIRNALGQTEEAADDWNGIKAAFRSGGKPVKLFLDGANRMDLEAEGGYEGMRKRLMGYAFLSSGGVPVDVFYQEELSSRFPGYFPASIQNPADQLIRIVSVIDQFRSIFRSPYAGSMAEDTEMLSQDILQRLYNSLTPSGNAAAFAEQHEDMVRAYYETKLQSTRDAWKNQVEQMKQGFADKQQEQRTAREERKLQEQLLHIAQRLDRVRVGSEWKSKAEELVGALDTAARSLTGKTIIGDYIGNVSSEGIETVRTNEKGQKVVTLDALREFVSRQQAENPDFLPDQKTMDKIKRLDKVQISDLTIGEIRNLLNAMQNLENEMRISKKLIDAADRRDVAIQAEEVRADISSSQGVSPTGVKKAWSNLITTQSLSPVRFLRRITGYKDNDPLYRAGQAMQDGETAMLDYQRRAEAKFRSFQENKPFMESLSGKKSKPVEITGRTDEGIQTVKITPDMRIAIYLHSKNSENVRHAERGGMVVPNYDLLMKGKTEEAYEQGTILYLTWSQMHAVGNGMTAMERNYANAIWEYFNTFSKDEINKVSRALLGYDIAVVRNYYPIEVNRKFTRAEPDAVKHDAKTESSGFLKSRTGAANTINLRGATETLERAMTQHAKYVGLAIPVRNFGKLYGNTSWSISPDPDDPREIQTVTSSVRDVLDRKWGSEAGRYIDKLMADIQNPVTSDGKWSRVFGKIRSNYAGAVLTLNLSVAMKQAASYPTAAAVVGWKPLAQAMTNWKTADLDRIAKYTPLLWYRSKGYSTKELGDLAKGNKSLPKALNWIQAIDVATTKKLWKAAEYYVRDNQKGLTIGSDDYYKAVANVYNRIILETQPNYTTMERPQLLRENDTLLQNLSMFKTQPMQNLNIAYDAIANLRAKERQLKAARDAEKDGQADAEQVKAAERVVREAKRNAANGISALLVSGAVFSAMTLLWNLFRGNKKKYQNDGEEVTALSFLKGFGGDMLSSFAGMAPFGSDVYEVVWSAITGDTYYGMEALTPSAISDFLETIVKVPDNVQDVVSAFQGDKSAVDVFWSVDQLAVAASKLLGIPVENVQNLMKAVSLNVMKTTMPAEEADYWYRYYTSKTSASKRRSQDYDDIYASAKAGNMDGYQEIRGKMEGWIWKENDSYQSGDISREEARERAMETVNGAMQDRIQEEFLSGTMQEKEAKELLTEIAGFDKDDQRKLDETVLHWACERDTGIKYDDLKDAYLGGEISGKKAAQYLAKYGWHEEGMTEVEITEEAEATVQKWDYQDESGNNRANESRSAMYYEYAQPAGIKISVFDEAYTFAKNAEADKDKDGESISGSAKQKVVDYILGLGLSSEQERALWNAVKGNWSDKDTPWH